MSITDIIIDVIIRSFAPADLARVQHICEAELDLEPDGGELPAILHQAPGCVGIVAETGGTLAGACLGILARASDGEVRGHVQLLVVARSAAGAGTGRRLLSSMENLLRGQGAAALFLSGSPPVYAWPGVDVRYTAMTCLAASAGYERYRDAVDMAVDLSRADLGTGPAEEALAGAGITVRRAEVTEAQPIGQWLRRGPWGGSGWPDEAAAALSRSPHGCHVAVRGERYVGFASHGANRRGWFGPMGTLAAERQHGIGSVLLKRCLADMRADGLRTARIGWVGPVRFYARTVGARIERVYWLYRKAV
jgi:mycothiol synthase